MSSPFCHDNNDDLLDEEVRGEEEVQVRSVVGNKRTVTWRSSYDLPPMTMSNLPTDLIEEIISRVPFKFMRVVQSTCKKWNALFKSRSFTKMHIGNEAAAARKLGETRMVVMMDYNVHLMGIVVNENPSIASLCKLTNLEDASEQVKISDVFHCEGLLLCILKDDDTKIVVWNPYLRQTRWIHTRKYCREAGWKGRDICNYALGYDWNSQCPKVLRFIDDFLIYPQNPALLYEVYDFDSDIWSTLEVSPHWRIMSRRGLSLKGNTYWGAVKRKAYGTINHIICFDFTRKRFGPLLPLPFSSCSAQFASLSSVREEKIAALFQTTETFKVEIWTTTKIEAGTVSWSNLFRMDTVILDQKLHYKSFFIDEEKKVGVVFDEKWNFTHNTINIIGEAGCLSELELVKPVNKECCPLVCSYVPSTLQIKQHKGGKKGNNKGIRF